MPNWIIGIGGFLIGAIVGRMIFEAVNGKLEAAK